MNLWRHVKTGGIYFVLDEDITIEKTMERAVLYVRVSTGEKWIRPYAEFHDGRFEVLNSQRNFRHEVHFSHNGEF